MPKQFNAALEEGLSVRLLCPQKHHDLLWKVMGVDDRSDVDQCQII